MEVALAGLWIFFAMLFDELRNFVFFSGFFEVHKLNETA
jgi:hypothetical protein